MEWLDKLKGFAPDIAAAIATGGGSLPATALRVASSVLLGRDDGTRSEVSDAVRDATPEQMLALTKCNQEFALRMQALANSEMQSARDAYDRHDEETDWTSRQIISKNPWLAGVILVMLGAVMVAAEVFNISPAVVGSVCTLGGGLANKLMDSYSQVCGFRFGRDQKKAK